MTGLATASWGALCAHRDRLDVQVVRISRGAPKFWPEAESFPAIELLMPNGFMFDLEGESFFRAYRRKLHIAGLEAVRAALDAIPGDKALACFEASPASCHRGPDGFSGWWFKQTGELIEERPVGRPESTQLQLDVERT